MSLYADRTILNIPDADVRDRALRTLEDRSRASRHLTSRQKERAEHLIHDDHMVARLIVSTEDDRYKEVLRHTLTPSSARTPMTLTPAQEHALARVNAVRAEMRLGLSGMLLPAYLSPDIVGFTGPSPSPIYDMATRVTTTQATYHAVHGDTEFSFADEFDEVGDDSPTLSRTVIPVHRCDSFTKVSTALVQDWPQMASSLAQMAQDAYRRMLADKLANGSGTGEPTGILTAMAASVDPAPIPLTTPATLTGADLTGAYESLPEWARESASCAWLSSTTTQNAVGANGADDPTFNLRAGSNREGALFGRPYRTSDHFPTFPTAGGTENLIVVGDWSQFVIAERIGLLMEFIPTMIGANNRPTSESGYLFWTRAGSAVRNADGFRLITNAEV